MDAAGGASRAVGATPSNWKEMSHAAEIQDGGPSASRQHVAGHRERVGRQVKRVEARGTKNYSWLVVAPERDEQT